MTEIQTQLPHKPEPQGIDPKLQKLKQLIDILEGKEQVHDKLKPILDPDNIQTSSNLGPEHIEFVADSFWLADQWPCFKPLKDFALEFAETKISYEGKGVENAIRFTGALAEGKLLKSLVFGSQNPEKHGRIFNRKKKEDESPEHTD